MTLTNFYFLLILKWRNIYKDKIVRIILLAPIDPLGGRIAHGRNNIEEFLIKAQEQIMEGKGNEIVSSDFDHDEVSYQTFVSWYKRDDFGRMFEFCDSNYDFPLLQRINIPVKIIVGTEDEYFYPTNPNHKQEAMNILLNKIKNSEGKFIENSGHNFNGFEEELVGEIMNFV